MRCGLRSRKAGRAEGIPLFSPHDLGYRRISLLHLRGTSWARIGEQVGQRDLAVTANVYTHVLNDERELDYHDSWRPSHDKRARNRRTLDVPPRREVAD
jgi:integrase